MTTFHNKCPWNFLTLMLNRSKSVIHLFFVSNIGFFVRTEVSHFVHKKWYWSCLGCLRLLNCQPNLRFYAFFHSFFLSETIVLLIFSAKPSTSAHKRAAYRNRVYLTDYRLTTDRQSEPKWGDNWCTKGRTQNNFI